MKTLKFSFFALALLLGLAVAWSVATPSQLTSLDATGGWCWQCDGTFPSSDCGVMTGCSGTRVSCGGGAGADKPCSYGNSGCAGRESCQTTLQSATGCP
jgi:hypothetical protein